ncbi:hypothetical protein BC936DRAFT_147810 [Jimgerdemannia flammicorona]|uniref:Uncharacterized protein n=2 Tax=Jimgerdemannia flammicorona TaxID=994334 RepID=A0A433D4I1_9FUNG|nr:hypothetical protein BC936DRAFT_147810 [Jimgerdemannia flammicorona]RUS27979.1 hypothetical protein BC938DRAFT_482494 [Jimgerdemannia flammicorona]
MTNQEAKPYRCRASTSFSKALCATPDLTVCALAPPSSSWVTSSLVTALTTSGPIGSVADHEGEVGQGGRVDGTASAWTHNEGELRDHAGGHDVALEDIGVAGQGVDTLLNAGAARVIEADDGGADEHGFVHDLEKR